jgi:hypothetical protein
MSDITEVPAPHAGLLTARSPGRTPSAQYITFLDEGGELISVPNFDFTDDALTPAIEELKNQPPHRTRNASPRVCAVLPFRPSHQSLVISIYLCKYMGGKGEFERARAAATFNMFAEPRRTLIQSRISDLRFGPNTVSRHPP